MPDVKVIIADRQPMFAEGLSIILNSVESIQVIATVINSMETLEVLKKEYCQVVILDIPAPSEDDLNDIRQIRKQYPQTQVLIFAGNYDTDMQAISSVMLAGASGFILKDTKKDELIQAILKVAAGEIFLGQSVTQVLADHYQKFRSLLPVNLPKHIQP